MRITRGDSNFHEALDEIQKKYFNMSGDIDAEIIINWNKSEAKEEGVVSFYACNSAASNAIKRCRPGIQWFDVYSDGVTFYFDTKMVRPLHTVLKIRK
jgi:glutamine phosphoribosylpyrophosphate amidotransferase